MVLLAVAGFCLTLHTLSHTSKGDLESPIDLHMHVFGAAEEIRVPGNNPHSHGRTCKLHIEYERDLVAVRCQHRSSSSLSTFLQQSWSLTVLAAPAPSAGQKRSVQVALQPEPSVSTPDEGQTHCCMSQTRTNQASVRINKMLTPRFFLSSQLFKQETNMTYCGCFLFWQTEKQDSDLVVGEVFPPFMWLQKAACINRNSRQSVLKTRVFIKLWWWNSST